MLTLLLMRHAKSSWDEPNLADRDRPLNRRGAAAAARMGKLLADEGQVPEVILSSSALRAVQTAARVAHASGFEGRIELRHSLYLAQPATYVSELRELRGVLRVLLVGHNPGIEELYGELTGQSQTYPTAAIGRIDLPLEGVNPDLSGHGLHGQPVQFWRPKELGKFE